MPATKVRVRTPEGERTYVLSSVKSYWLYDTVLVANGDTEKYFFLSPEGKTPAETNLKQFSTIPAGWFFEVHSIRLIPEVGISIADAKILFSTSAVSYMREGVEEYFQIPAEQLNAGCGLYGATTTTATDIVSLGIPASGAIMKLPIRVELRGGETFNFKWYWRVAVSGLSASRRVRMSLDGVLKRPVSG